MKSPDFPTRPVLIVDDELDAIHACEVRLRSGGITNTIACDDSRDVMRLIDERQVGIVLLDLSMPHLSGEQLLELISRDYPEVAILIVTAANEVATAVRCMQAGAFDYMVKPVEKSRMISGIQRAIEYQELHEEYSSFKERVLSNTLAHPEAFSGIITNNPLMNSLFQYVETIAETSRPVLVTGETGTGKELIARVLHELSGRKGLLVEVNAAGLDDAVFADTLFGHVKGAFTGADEARQGLIEQASGGTLLLDEIGDLSLPSQVKLLRLLQEGHYSPLGSDIPKRTDARVVATTNRDIEALREAGHFRADLFYRLSTHHVHLPPLRKRLDDLPLLLDHFLEKSAEALGKRKPTPPEELANWLSIYDFPGNVRELEGMLFDAVSKHGGRMLSMDAFKDHISTAPVPSSEAGTARPKEEGPLLRFQERLPTLKEATDLLILEALGRAGGNQSVAAKLLNMSRPTLSRRLKQLSG